MANLFIVQPNTWIRTWNKLPVFSYRRRLVVISRSEISSKKCLWSWDRFPWASLWTGRQGGSWDTPADRWIPDSHSEISVKNRTVIYGEINARGSEFFPFRPPTFSHISSNPYVKCLAEYCFSKAPGMGEKRMYKPWCSWNESRRRGVESWVPCEFAESCCECLSDNHRYRHRCHLCQSTNTWIRFVLFLISRQWARKTTPCPLLEARTCTLLGH